jgi:hypothetical protein
VPALPHAFPAQLLACCLSTALFNMLDLPAGNVPTGKVTADDDANLADDGKWPAGKFPFRTSRYS